VSTIEWIPSDSIAELPVIKAAVNFVIAIRVLPISAAIITLVDPDAIECSWQVETGRVDF
jgi:hypothetical protein